MDDDSQMPAWASPAAVNIGLGLGMLLGLLTGPIGGTVGAVLGMLLGVWYERRRAVPREWYEIWNVEAGNLCNVVRTEEEAEEWIAYQCADGNDNPDDYAISRRTRQDATRIA